MNPHPGKGWFTRYIMRNQHLIAQGVEPFAADFRAYVRKIHRRTRRKDRLMPKPVQALIAGFVLLASLAFGQNTSLVSVSYVTNVITSEDTTKARGSHYWLTNITVRKDAIFFGRKWQTNYTAIGTNVVKVQVIKFPPVPSDGVKRKLLK